MSPRANGNIFLSGKPLEKLHPPDIDAKCISLHQSASVRISNRCILHQYASLIDAICIITFSHRGVKTSHPDNYFIVELIESLGPDEDVLKFPANSHSLVTMKVPYTTSAAVNLYSLTGSLVARQGPFDYQTGTHTLSFDLANFPSGCYLLTFETRDFTLTRKLVVVR